MASKELVKDASSTDDEIYADNKGEILDAEGDQLANGLKQENPERGHVDGERRENTRIGVWKRLTSVMCPCGSRLKWGLIFNLESSTSAEKASSEDAIKIKRLQEENQRLKNQALQFRDKHKQLKTRIGELSEVEGQLIATRSNNDRLEEELQDLQRSRESLSANLTKQSEEHRAEANRLDAELKKAAKDLAKLEQEKNSVEDKDKKNVENLQLVRKDLQTLSSNHDALKLELNRQKDLHHYETTRLQERLERAEKERNEHQETIAKLKGEIKTVEHRARMAEEKNARVKQKIETVKRKTELLRHQYPCGGVPIWDLQYLDDRIAEAANEA